VGKRSDFKRRPQDAYQTIDPRAVEMLLPHLNGTRTFAEPCSGKRYLVRALVEAGLDCVWSSDIDDIGAVDALQLTWNMVSKANSIITNPPWSRDLLHQMIVHFQSLKPTWLLFDSDWAYNKTSAPYLKTCSDIVVIGRLKWIENTSHNGKDNCSWYRFSSSHRGPTKFHNWRQ
jgi:hypothetical protein